MPILNSFAISPIYIIGLNARPYGVVSVQDSIRDQMEVWRTQPEAFFDGLLARAASTLVTAGCSPENLESQSRVDAMRSRLHIAHVSPSSSPCMAHGPPPTASNDYSISLPPRCRCSMPHGHAPLRYSRTSIEWGLQRLPRS